MVDLTFKRHVSRDRRLKTLLSSERFARDGLETVVYRKLVCRIREIPKDAFSQLPAPEVFIYRSLNTKTCNERFLCRVKSNLCLFRSDKVYHIALSHSLKILIRPAQ
jgi:hypothetical protein